MCEILIRIVDKNPDQLGASLAGDVVAVFDDGHQFGASETNAAYWRIVNIPGLSANAMNEFMDVQHTLGGTVTAYRSVGFDFTELGALFAQTWQPVVLSKESAWDFFALKTARTRIDMIG